MGWYVSDGTLHSTMIKKEENIQLNITDKGEVFIPHGITALGHGAFFRNSQIRTIILPDSVTTIEDCAFSGCKNLQSINLPDSITFIGNSAFSECTNLQSINIPNGVTSIAKRAFADCENLRNISLPDSITSIGEFAFAGCKNLRNINLPNSITSIGKYAFHACKNLQSLSIPDSTALLGQNVFICCYNLIALRIPAKLITYLDKTALPFLNAITCPISLKKVPFSLRLKSFSIRTKLCLGFALLEDDYCEELRTEYLTYIRRHASKLIMKAFDYPDFLALLCREKMITSKDIDNFVRRAVYRGIEEIPAFLLDYQESLKNNRP